LKFIVFLSCFICINITVLYYMYFCEMTCLCMYNIMPNFIFMINYDRVNRLGIGN
jgi:hypothetical protein